MPMTYQIDPAAGTLLIVAVGDLTQAERIEGMRTWQSDPLYRPGLTTLADFSECTSTPDLAQIRELIAFIERRAEKVGRKKFAIVTATPLMFGVARQFQALADSGPLDVGVFTSRAEALAWLLQPIET